MNTLAELLSNTSDDPAVYKFGCQIQKCTQRLTKSQKPYLELQFGDAAGVASLKAWNNHPQFEQSMQLKAGDFLCIEGSFTKNQYGLDSQDWQWSYLSDEAKETLLLGDPELKIKQEEDWAYILKCCDELADPRLHALCAALIEEFADRYRRAAAARKNHHARRGGLVEHVAQMMRTAEAICVAYPDLNRDILITAILFHDCGKLWENNYPESDFNQLYQVHAEALGHITLGIELANKLWRDVMEEHGEQWRASTPPSEHVRLHLLHLIASHHGQLDFGSPVVPKTPEAFALHYIDNLDAKIEMCKMSYENSSKLSSQIYEKAFPLPGNLIAPLPKFSDQ